MSILSVLLSGTPLWSQSSPISDDFNGSSLNTSLWTVSAPAGGTVAVSNGHANLNVPGGSNHDAVVGGDNSVRILQNISNSNFDVAAKFDSIPTQQYSGEGILVQQNTGTYLRLEFSSNGSQTSLSANFVTGGNQTALGSIPVTVSGSSLWLQVSRTGNSFTISYSTDGVNYGPGVTFSQSLTVASIGPYAWNYNATPANSPAITGAVDYFYNLSGGTTTPPPTFNPASGTTFSSTLSVSISDSASGAVIYYTTDNSTPTTNSTVYSGPFTISQTTTVKAIALAGTSTSSVSTATYTQATTTVATPTFNPASGATFASTLSVSISDSTSGATIHYTTDNSTPTASSPVYSGSFTISQTTTVKAIATAGGGTSAVGSATYTLTSSGGGGAPVSDDFNGSSLNTSLWTPSATAGGTVTVSNGHVNLAVPGGSNHDAFVGGNESVNIMQSISNANFDVAAKFDSIPSKQYQGEGIFVQQNSGTYLRIEFSSDGNQTTLFTSLVSGGNQTSLGSIPVAVSGSSLWLQVLRSGNTFTATYSTDGVNYAPGITFSQSLSVTAIGPYAWNYNVTPANSPAMTAAVDYFYNLSGSGTSLSISNVAANAGSATATITWTTNLASTSAVQYGTTTSYGQNASNSSAVTSHSLSLTGLICATTYDYQVSSTAGTQSAQSGNATFQTGSCSTGGGPVSDDFDSTALNTSLWTFVNPAGDGVLTMNGTAATINLPAQTVHDPWVNGNGSVRLMQNISNSDFTVQVRFQSDVEIGNQDEGILVQQSVTNFLRFDLLNNGSGIQLFAAGINGSNANVFSSGFITIAQAPVWLQLQRTGNTWTGTWSTDGVNFHAGFTATYAMTVTSVGPFAGNANPNVANSPAFTAIVDYFFNTASPVSNQDGHPPFQAITVDANPPSTLVEKALADIQGTGHLNPVAGFEPIVGSSSATASNGGIFWYEYPASGVLTDPWIKHTIISNGQAYEDMAPLDVNNDGAVDIVASYSPVQGGNLNLVWFQNPRGSGGNPATDPWTMHMIGSGNGENNLVLGDFDGDGKPDLATGTFIYFQNNPDSWTQVQYNSAFRGVALFDIGSGKGSINLVSAGGPVQSNSSYNAVWFENPRETGGNARTGQWLMHTIGPGYPCNDTTCPGGDFYVANFGSGDFNGDGRMDVVMGQSEGPFGVAPPPGGLVWFEAPADRRNGNWILHTINANFVDAHNVRVADMDHNGTLDLITAEQDQSSLRRVGVFYNDGAGNFSLEILSNAAGHQTAIGDVVGTGAIDLLSSGHGYEGMIHPVQIFLNPVQ